MLGFIALAGIIVRNSILLVDFIRHGRTPDRPLREVLIEAGAIRFKPILLIALAALIGAAVILTDSIFQGLAISPLFGLDAAGGTGHSGHLRHLLPLLTLSHNGMPRLPGQQATGVE
jgi:multidrug efflux pump subunit AcrB